MDGKTEYAPEYGLEYGPEYGRQIAEPAERSPQQQLADERIAAACEWRDRDLRDL